MRFEQFTYTGSPWGATAPGWTVFQSSAGIDTDAVSSFKPYFRFPGDSSVPDSVVGEIDGQKLPIRFVFATDKETGRYLIVQSLDAGLRWYDTTRGRDYFAHVFVQTDAGTVPEDVPVGFNPVALVLSPSIQTEFPDEFREKALQIMNGERPNEPTPDLPTLGSLSEVEPNERYADENLFDRLSPGAVEKVGHLVAAMSGLGRKTVFFDATKPESLDCLASCVRLIPFSLRIKLNFATWIPANEIQAFPEIETVSFVGTIRSGESADPDTGLYGELPQGGPEFRSREDVELFKRMVDAGGAELKAEDFDDLVACWEVASGKTSEVSSLRAAAVFADRFPGLKAAVEDGLAETLGDDGGGNSDLPSRKQSELALVAWFECGFEKMEYHAKTVCGESIGDKKLFEDCLKLLDGSAARRKYLEAVAEMAELNDSKAMLARMWLDCNREVREGVLRDGGDGSFTSLAERADRFNRILHDVEEERVAPEGAAGRLEEINEAEIDLGDDFPGMQETRNRLFYLDALHDLRRPEDIPVFIHTIRKLSLSSETVRDDVLKRVPPGKLEPGRLVLALDDYSKGEVPREEVVRLALEEAERRGRLAGYHDGCRKAEEERKRAETAEERAKAAEAKRGVPTWLATIATVLMTLAGFGAGFFLASPPGRFVCFGPDTNRESDAVRQTRDDESPKEKSFPPCLGRSFGRGNKGLDVSSTGNSGGLQTSGANLEPSPSSASGTATNNVVSAMTAPRPGDGSPPCGQTLVDNAPGTDGCRQATRNDNPEAVGDGQ